MFDLPIIKTLLLYLPISIIGIWRWSYWIVRRTAAKMYRPKTTEWPASLPEPTVSVVTPVYNEDPAIFRQAIDSWIKNGASEIIAVIDKSNIRHIVEFERHFASDKKLGTKCRMVVTPKPGKRAALCDGIMAAKGDIIALVDSDTIWDDHVLKSTLPYFLNEQVGGATVTQRIYQPKDTGDVLFDLLLWTRYRDEVPYLMGVGKAFNTLSGRTAFYRREAIFHPKHDNLHKLRHEFFLGTRGISGDDKRLTHLILEQGWHTAYVLGSTVYTPGIGSLKKFMKQRLRWTRNSWRADLRAMVKGWVWKHPALGLYMLDRFIQPFVMLIGPVVFAISLINREWLFAGILLAWWFVSRFIRLFAYFRQYPRRLVYLPAYILFSYVTAVVKVYALATIVEHSWATRWHKHRLKRKKLMRRTVTVGSGVAAVLLLVFGIWQFALYIRSSSGANIALQPPEVASRSIDKLSFSTKSPTQPGLPENSVLPTGVKQYIVRSGDTLNDLSKRFNVSVIELKKLNSISDPDKLNEGRQLQYYQR